MESEQIAASSHDRAPGARVLAAFGLSGEVPVALPFGEGRSYRAGNAVLKHLHGGSDKVVRWDAELRVGLPEDGFRVDRPLRTQIGDWLTDDGWSASAILAGHHEYREHVPECIAAIERYHTALQSSPRPAFMDTLAGPYRRADVYAFEERPATVHPALTSQIDALYAVRLPLANLEDQLIHGDLNPGNLLIADGQPPGIIDMAPYWRPAGFALAVFAYWIGPWRDRPDLLAHFAQVVQFEQLLIRAGLRMLLFLSESGRLMDMDRYTRATTLILERHGC